MVIEGGFCIEDSDCGGVGMKLTEGCVTKFTDCCSSKNTIELSTGPGNGDRKFTDGERPVWMGAD